MEINELSLFFVYFKQSFLPDVYLFFRHHFDSDAQFIAFLRVFSGCKITLPTDEQMAQIARDAELYEAYKKQERGQLRRKRRSMLDMVRKAGTVDSTICKKLAKHYKITPKETREVVARLKHLEHHGRLPSRRNVFTV